MPLLRRTTVPLEPIPVQDSENKIKDVWQVRFTGEIFTDYNKYIDKLMLYKKPIWTCELTGKMNLTYEDALKSERDCREKTKNTYPEVWIPITLQMAQYKQGKLNDIVDKIYDYLKDKYIVGEIVFFTIPNTQQQKSGKIVSINEELSDKEKKYHIHMISKYGKEIKAGDLGNKPVEYDVDFDSIRRDRCIYSKQLMRNFLRESTTRDTWLGAPIVVKPSIARKYGISDEPPSDLKDLIQSKTKKRKRHSEDDSELSSEGETEDDSEEEEGNEEENKNKKSKKSKKHDKEDNDTEEEESSKSKSKSSKKNKERELKKKEEDEKEKERHREKEKEEMRKQMIASLKFPIEDLELPKYFDEDESLEVPKPVDDFGSISQKQVSSALMVWDFLCVYGKPLNLFPFTFDFFEKALTYKEDKPINFLIKEIFCSLLILILNNYKTLNNNNYAHFDRRAVDTTSYSVDTKYSNITMNYLKSLIIHDKKPEYMVIDESLDEDDDEMMIGSEVEEEEEEKEEETEGTKIKNESDNNNMSIDEQSNDDDDQSIKDNKKNIKNKNSDDAKTKSEKKIEMEQDDEDGEDGDDEEENIEINPEEEYQVQTNDPFIWEIFPNHYHNILSIFEKYPIEFGPWYKWKPKAIAKKKSGRNYNINIENISELEDRIEGWEVVLLSCLIEYGCPSKIPGFESIIAKLCCIDSFEKNQSNNIPLIDIIKSGFLSLTSDEKIMILRFLIDELAINCSAIRDFIDHSFEVLTELRKQKIEISRERKELIKLKHEFNNANNPSNNNNNNEIKQEGKDETSNSMDINSQDKDDLSIISITSNNTNHEEIRSKKISTLSYESDSYGGTSDDNSNYDSPGSFNPSRATLRQKMMMQKKLEKEEKERKRREEYNHYREEALDHIRQNRKRNAEKRKLEDREKNIERRQQAIDIRWKGWSAMIRMKLLGRDRYYNKYWWYDGSWLGSNNSSYDRSNNKGFGANSSNVIPSWGTGKLFVENVNFDKNKKDDIELEDEKYSGVDSKWSYYSTPAELDVLLEWLNPKGVRESQLLKNLMKILNDMVSIMIKREQDLTNLLIKNENLENKRTTRSGTNNYQNQLASCYLGYYNRWMEV